MRRHRVQLAPTGDEPTFGNATLSTPQDPTPPPPPPVEETPPPSQPAPLVKAAVKRATTATGATVAQVTGDEELELIVPAATRSASLRGGLRVEATAPGAGRMSAKLVYKGRTLGSATRTVTAAGRVTLKLKLTNSGRKAVKRLTGKKVQLRMTFTPKGDGAKLTTSARVTLR